MHTTESMIKRNILPNKTLKITNIETLKVIAPKSSALNTSKAMLDDKIEDEKVIATYQLLHPIYDCLYFKQDTGHQPSTPSSLHTY